MPWWMQAIAVFAGGVALMVSANLIDMRVPLGRLGFFCEVVLLVVGAVCVFVGSIWLLWGAA